MIFRLAAAAGLAATVSLQGSQAPRPIDRLAWLAGCWQAASPRRVAQETTMVVFENPAHDYPQRIGYRRVGADSLLAWIDGTARGRQRRVDYPFARGCDAR